MLPTRTPRILKWLYPSLIWDKYSSENFIYLTFDDGPHPEITPWVMDELDKFGFKAAFFCIGDNVRHFPETYQEILNRGHQVGNHTFNHLSGFRIDNKTYFQNIELTNQLIKSEIFRPPYGHLNPIQVRHLKTRYEIIMWSLLAEDWNSKLDAKVKLEKLKKLTKPGDIIVFHDSEKAEKNLKFLLPKYLEFLNQNNYKSKLFI